MENLKFREILLKTSYDCTKESDEVVNYLARLGHPPAKVIQAIIESLHGKKANILIELIDALDEIDGVYDDELLYNQIWFYFARQESSFDDCGFADFVCKLAKGFYGGAYSFPINKEVAYELMPEIGITLSYNDAHRLLTTDI